MLGCLQPCRRRLAAALQCMCGWSRSMAHRRSNKTLHWVFAVWKRSVEDALDLDLHLIFWIRFLAKLCVMARLWDSRSILASLASWRTLSSKAQSTLLLYVLHCFSNQEIGMMCQHTYISNPGEAGQHVFSKVVSPHLKGTHPEQPLPTGYKGVPFIVGQGGFPGVCDIGVCCNFRGFFYFRFLGWPTLWPSRDFIGFSQG